MAATAQGATVGFNGAIGSALGFAVSPGSASATDVTSHGSAVVDGRVIRDYVCLAIDSGSATVRLLGMPAYTRNDIGQTGVFSVTTSSGSVSSNAILSGFEIEGEVGDLLRGSATFILIGD
jgi:hypothetical protein